MPTAQILVTTYNQEKYIAQALESLLKQKTNFSFQIIIADDGSTDRNREICEQYQAKHPRQIKLLPKTTNQGRFKNLEKLLKATTANYLAICAGDDYWLDENKLQKQVDFLEKNPDFTICYTKYQEINENKNSKVIKPNEKEMKTESETDINNFLQRWRIASSSMVFRREILKNFPYQKFHFLEDTHLVYYAMLQGKGKILDFIGTVYRVHENNVYGNQDEIKQAIINQKVFYDLTKEFNKDKVLIKRLNYLNFKIVQYYKKNNNQVEAEKYLKQFIGLKPRFLINFNYKFYAILQRIIGYNK